MSDSSAREKISTWLTAFDQALSSNNAAAAAELFEESGFWRDLVSFTWNIKTLEGRDQIQSMLENCLDKTKPSNWAIEEEPTEADGICESWITFETGVARGRGHLRLRDGKAFTFLTTLVELKGYEEARGVTRGKGVDHGVESDRQNWLQKRQAEEQELGYSKQPYCVVIGGGQGGIALGARMRMLGVPTIVVEKNERPGDAKLRGRT